MTCIESTDSCWSTTVNCPEDYACEISCGESACSHSPTFNWSETPGLGSLNCEGAGSCKGVDFPKPDPKDSTILTCEDESQCRGSTMYCSAENHCLVICDGERSCEGSTVVCAQGEYDCNIQCNAEDSCKDVHIYLLSAL